MHSQRGEARDAGSFTCSLAAGHGFQRADLVSGSRSLPPSFLGLHLRPKVDSSALMTFRNGCRHTMTDIAVSTGIPPSTAHRLIKDLTASQLLERTEEGDYQLGLPIRLSATFNRPSRSIDGIAQVLLQDLSDVTGCGVRLGVLSGSVVAFVEKQAGRRPASLLASEIGKNPAQIRARLAKGADDLGQSGTDPYYGSGRINVNNTK